MSVKLLSWAFHESPADLRPVEFVVLLALSDAADDDGVVRYMPDTSQEALARKSRVSRRTLQRTMDTLVARGLVERTQESVLDPYSYRVMSMRQNDAPSMRHADAPGGVTLTHRTSIDVIDVNTPDSFDSFWALWPRRDAKKAARTAWDRAVKRAGGDLPILEGARRFVAAGREARFVPYAATWLNGDRWEDELQVLAAAGDDGSVDLTAKWGLGNEWMEHAR